MIDVALGGMRAYTDDRLEVGTRIEVDLLIGDDEEILCWARVAWVEPLPSDAGAAFDMGLEFTDIADDARQTLAAALGVAP